MLDQAEALFGPSPVLDEERHDPRRRPGRAATGGRSRGPPGSTTPWAGPSCGRETWDGRPRRSEQAVRLAAAGPLAELLPGPVRVPPGPVRGRGHRLQRLHRGGARGRGLLLQPRPGLRRPGPHRAGAARLRPGPAARSRPWPSRALNRGMLHYRARRYPDALADLERARKLGADPAAVSYNLALVDLARGEHAAALDDLRQALVHDPHHPDARGSTTASWAARRRHEAGHFRVRRPRTLRISLPASRPGISLSLVRSGPSAGLPDQCPWRYSDESLEERLERPALGLGRRATSPTPRRRRQAELSLDCLERREVLSPSASPAGG